MNYTILEHLQKLHGEQFESEKSVIRFVSNYLDKNPELKTKSRKRQLVDERRFLMSVLKKHTKLSLVKIGIMFGNRDHATVLWNLKKHELFIETNDEIYKDNVSELRSIFKQILP